MCQKIHQSGGFFGSKENRLTEGARVEDETSSTNLFPLVSLKLSGWPLGHLLAQLLVVRAVDGEPGGVPALHQAVAAT